MTYCLSLLCREGIICVSDSRTSAGVDNINIRPKMRLYSVPGERVVCLMTSGNLSVTQTVIALIEEDTVRARTDPAHPHLLTQPTLFETARYVGEKIRRVSDLDRVALERDGFNFNINVIVAGQIAGGAPELHYVYPQGNSIQATVESPFLQIGEYKYGKPILHRGFSFETRLSESVKFALLSMEATIRSNVSVGGPFDVFVYETDSLQIRHRRRIEENDPYFRELAGIWTGGIISLVEKIPTLTFDPPPS